jgi:hypothetical protein
MSLGHLPSRLCSVGFNSFGRNGLEARIFLVEEAVDLIHKHRELLRILFVCCLFAQIAPALSSRALHSILR